ncbi:transposase [Marinagarivorans cellulosilyticus]|uniref:Transposase IS200-like domain-containing protein n=1 Tax=Marinagarivorans cellulosilyticus TaxID=2721545 RepID=A0AAN1WLD6_9GAMM|nr:transposase [Marinagarivorans cellulosilyticus]BCD99657.1 hypothetical protein MARGE09_P3859 [Marinagarivorans cellulosilyticus]
MTQARRTLISLDQTSWFHICSRCIKRSFLMGEDKYSGKNYEHRREWISDKLAELGDIFALDIAAYAVLSNHYHLVLHIDAEKAAGWSDKTVIRRWMMLFKGNELALKVLKNQAINEAEQYLVDDLVAEWRKRLSSISWFMRCLNEHIARLANAEDKCTGRFWEGRFKSQALLDEQAIITCMAYVDLNPVRAGMAELPETSDFTAIQQRIQSLNKPAKKAKDKKPIRLANFCKPPKKNHLPTADSVDQGQRSTGVIPFYWRDYLELIDWTGRAILPNKSGAIALASPKILRRLEINCDDWLENMPRIETDFHHCIGRGDAIRPCAEKLDQCWVKGLGAARRLFGC